MPAGAAGADVQINTGLKGDRMPYVPDLTWSATADYYLPLDGRLEHELRRRLCASSTIAPTARPSARSSAWSTRRPSSSTEITEPLAIDSY